MEGAIFIVYLIALGLFVIYLTSLIIVARRRIPWVASVAGALLVLSTLSLGWFITRLQDPFAGLFAMGLASGATWALCRGAKRGADVRLRAGG